MKRKIFISINIPDRIRKRLAKAMEKWNELPVKWVKEANLHVTLFFLGHIDDETTQRACQAVREIVSKTDIFDLEFEKIELGPDVQNPRLVWLTGQPSGQLLELYEKIEKELGMFSASRKEFRPHVTLGRIRKYKWEEIGTAPQISEKFSLAISVESIDVMASHFGEGDSEYAVIESCPLR